MKSSALKTLAAAVLLTASFGAIADDLDRDGIDDSPSAGAMAFDLVIIRPISLVATVLGTGVFILQLPLSLLQWEAPSEPAQQLIVKPAQYTFTRPLGQMD